MTYEEAWEYLNYTMEEFQKERKKPENRIEIGMFVSEVGEKMSNNKRTAQDKLSDLIKSKELLAATIGKENFESIVDEITGLVEKYNLETTPTILKDLFDYIVNNTLLTRNF